MWPAMMPELAATSVSGPVLKIWSARCDVASADSMKPPIARTTTASNAFLTSDRRLIGNFAVAQSLVEIWILKIGRRTSLAGANRANLNRIGRGRTSAADGFCHVHGDVQLNRPIEITKIDEGSGHVKLGPLRRLNDQPPGKTIGEENLSQGTCSRTCVPRSGRTGHIGAVLMFGLQRVSVRGEAQDVGFMIERLHVIGIHDVADRHGACRSHLIFGIATAPVIREHGLKPACLKVQSTLVFPRAGTVKFDLN